MARQTKLSSGTAPKHRYRQRHPLAGPSPTLRERVIWDLRNKGYSFREIAELLRITKQRACQIEERMNLRSLGTEYHKPGTRALGYNSARHQPPVRSISSEEFERRLEAINIFHEARFDSALRRTYRRRKCLNRRAARPTVTLFWKLWPLIEIYQRKPFSFSTLVEDFPHLAKERYLQQLLFRLRKTGVLNEVGLKRVAGHNLPEVLMVEAPIEQHAAANLDKIVAQWSKKLQQLQRDYLPIRPDRSIQSMRRRLIANLMEEGFPKSEIEAIFGPRQGKPRSRKGKGAHLGRASTPVLSMPTIRSRDPHLYRSGRTSSGQLHYAGT